MIRRGLLHRLLMLRLVQRITGVHRIHHIRWSFGFRLPFTTWCWFEPTHHRNEDQYRAHSTWDGHPWVLVAYGWKRCERSTYHDSTSTGRY